MNHFAVIHVTNPIHQDNNSFGLKLIHLVFHISLSYYLWNICQSKHQYTNFDFD